MPLTALDIYKILPKTNCGECGVPTCLAFAMQLATKKAGIDACPYASDDAKATLAGAAAPPIRPGARGAKGRAAAGLAFMWTSEARAGRGAAAGGVAAGPPILYAATADNW